MDRLMLLRSICEQARNRDETVITVPVVDILWVLDALERPMTEGQA